MTDLTREGLIDAIEKVMIREGGRLAEWHGWRCAYPEQYGQCDCNREVAADIAKDLLPLIADAIEALEWAWHFRGPGDPGVQIVSRAAVLDLVRNLMGDER
jgi:hypothetical protein